MTFDLISGLHMQIQTWHPPLRFCIHAKYYVKSGLKIVLKNANKTKNMSSNGCHSGVIFKPEKNLEFFRLKMTPEMATLVSLSD